MGCFEMGCFVMGRFVMGRFVGRSLVWESTYVIFTVNRSFAGGKYLLWTVFPQTVNIFPIVYKGWELDQVLLYSHLILSVDFVRINTVARAGIVGWNSSKLT
jgi:hypothetical protein